MKKRIIKIVTTMILSMSIVSMVAIVASGLGIQHVSMNSGLFENSIEAGFTESAKGTGSYGTNKDKVVKQCYVRLKEGSYDSGRSFSDEGKKKGGTRYIWSKKLSKSNNLFQTCTTNYGWKYY